MLLNSPWEIIAVVAAVGLLRVIYTVWRESPYRGLMLELSDSLLIAFALVFFLIKPFVVAAFFIPSGSMRPTLVEHDRVLVNKFIYEFTVPRRQDIIVFAAPPEATSKHQDFIKRLIGLPGDVIQVRSYDGVYINGVKLNEPYIGPLEMADYNYGPERVPQGHYFVMGDNRRDSNDSHRWGFLDQRNVLGKAMIIFWPLGRLELVR
jgi:signal peptidase I